MLGNHEAIESDHWKKVVDKIQLQLKDRASVEGEIADQPIFICEEYAIPQCYMHIVVAN